MAFLVVSKLTKTYPNESQPCVQGLSFELERGQFLSLLGPSGHGKTTTLRIIAGHEQMDSGDVTLGDQRLAQLPPQKRPVAMVFQDLALFPPPLGKKKYPLWYPPPLSGRTKPKASSPSRTAGHCPVASALASGYLPGDKNNGWLWPGP